MNTASSQITSRALFLADMVNNTAITYQDKLNSLNESYKDLYSLLLDSDDDYFYTEVLLTITPAMVDSTAIGGVSEWLIPLPSDFMRLRCLEYSAGNVWIQLDKYTPNRKTSTPSNYQYRFRGNNLHIIGGSANGSLAVLRLGYYPQPATLSLPAPSINIGGSLTWANQTALVSPCFTGSYVSGGNINTANGSIGRVVYYNGTAIVCEDEDLNTVTTLYTVANVTQVLYAWGYVYYLTSSGSIYRFQSDLMSLGVPSLVVTPATAPVVFGFLTPTVANTPNNYNPPLLLWCSDTSTYTSIYQVNGTLVGTTSKGYSAFFTCGAYFYGLDPLTGLLYQFQGTTFLLANGINIPYGSVQWAGSDGTSIYVMPSYTSTIHKLTLNSTNTGVMYDVTLATDANITIKAANVSYGILTYQQMDNSWLGISLAEDTQITYPNNLVPELIEYQGAIDFTRKQHGDTSELEKRFTSLFTRYKDSLIRDDNKPERIQNAYARLGGLV